MRGAGRSAVRRPGEKATVAANDGPAVRRGMQLTPPLRKLVLATHVIVSVGWLGIVAAMLVLEISAVTTHDVGMSKATYTLIGSVSDTLLMPPPASFGLAALLTGIVLSLGTKWGLLKHYWILAKLLLTVAVILSGIFLVDRWIQQAGAHPEDASAPMLLICVFMLHLVMLGAATILSVYKPRGTTGRGPGSSAPRGAMRRADGGARIAPGVRTLSDADATDA